jgi:hypothetical protein
MIPLLIVVMIMAISKLKHDNTTTMYSTTFVIQGRFALTPQLLNISCVSFTSEAKWQRITVF